MAIDPKMVELVRRLNSDPEMQTLLDGEDRDCWDSAALAASGVPYTLVGKPVKPPTVIHLVALAIIDSPLTESDDQEDIDGMDCWRALWAVTASPEDLSPLMGLDARTRSLRKLVKNGLPHEAVARLIDDAVSEAWQKIDSDVIRLAAQYQGATAQQVADVVMQMMADCAEAWALLPHSNQKKTVGGSAATGWARCFTWLTPQAWSRVIPRFGVSLRRVLAYLQGRGSTPRADAR